MPTVSKIQDNEIVIGRKTYLVDDDVVIKINGKKSSLSAIKPGMRAMVTGKIIARGKTTEESLYEARRITVRTKK